MKKCLLISILLSAVFSARAQDSISLHTPAASLLPKTEIKDKLPEFPGGHKAFIKEFLSHFRTWIPLASGVKEASATAIFIVEKDGSMADIRIESSENDIVKKEFLKALQKIKTQWIPGEKNGEKAIYRMRQPLVFSAIP